MAKTGCVLSNLQFQHVHPNFLFVSWWVILFRRIHLHDVHIYSDSTPTLKASMHWPSGLCSTSKSSEKCSSSCRWASTDRVYWQLAFSAYGAGQEGLDMSPLLSPDRSPAQLTVLTIRYPCHHHHYSNQHNQVLPNQSSSHLIPAFPSLFSSPCLPASASSIFSTFTSSFSFVPFPWLVPFSVPVYDRKIICTSASVMVHGQVVAMATGAVVPSNEVVTELRASIVRVILTFIKVWGRKLKGQMCC